MAQPNMTENEGKRRENRERISERLPSSNLPLKTLLDNEAVLDELSRCLDKEMKVLRNWVHLADKLGIPANVVKQFKGYTDYSPTIRMFEYLQATRPDMTLGELCKALENINRFDATNLISESGFVELEDRITDTIAMNGKLLESISNELDSSRYSFGSWRKLGYELEIPRPKLKEFEMYSQSPSRMLFRVLKANQPQLTVGELRKHLLDMERKDVLQIIDRYSIEDSSKVADSFRLDSSFLNEVERRLNLSISGVRDWRSLASQLSISSEMCDDFEGKSGQRSPTKQVLGWLAVARLGTTVRDIIKALEQIERHDAIKILIKVTNDVPYPCSETDDHTSVVEKDETRRKTSKDSHSPVQESASYSSSKEANHATYKELPAKVRNFTGRQKDIDEIKSHIKGPAPRMTVIVAPPGYGKTALATEIGYEMYEKEHFSVICVSAREHCSLESLAKEILDCLSKTPGNDPVNQAQYQLKSLKEQTLLIIDNTEDLQVIEDEGEEFIKFIERLLNSSRASHLAIIVTTRKPFDILAFEFQQKVLEPLSKNSSAELLDHLTRNKKGIAKICKDLGEACGGIPLYIRIVASLITNSYNPAVLLQKLRSNPIAALEMKNRDAQEYHESLLKFLQDCLDADLLRKLIRVATFPKDFSVEDATVVIKDQDDYAMLFVTLVQRALLYENDNLYSLHPFIQSLCKNCAEAIDLEEEALDAQLLFNSHYIELLDQTQKEFFGWNSCKLAIEKFKLNKVNIFQAVYNCLQPEKPKEMKRRCASVCLAATNFLAEVITSDEFHKMYSHCCKIAQSIGDRKIKSFLRTSLGFRHMIDSAHLKLNPNAWKTLQRAHQIQMSELSKEDRDCEEHAQCMSKLGLCYVMSGEEEMVKKGVTFVKNAIKLRERLKNQVLIAAGYGELANTYRHRGEFQQAIEIWEFQTLAEYWHLLGKHPFTASTLNWIGICYTKLNDFDKAAEYKTKALHMRKELLGSDHQDVLRSDFELAQIEIEQGHLETARDRLKDIVSRQEKLLGSDPHTVETCKTLKVLYESLGDKQGANTMGEKAELHDLEIMKRQIDHQSLAATQEAEA